MVLLVISKPANSTLSLVNLNFLGLRVMPCLPQVSSQLAAWWKLSSIVTDHRRLSCLVLMGLHIKL